MKNLTRMQKLVEKLNEYRNAYYNLNHPLVTDEVYDRLFDELVALEKETGCVLSQSPTVTVGYTPVSGLEKMKHPTPLLSLDKVKSVFDVISFIGDKPAMLMYKLDGLTVRLDYENGKLVAAGTRGDGNVGENITHNIPAFLNVPLEISCKTRLSISGEAFIHTSDFKAINAGLSEVEKFSTARNFAAGSVRAYNPEICKERKISFYAFNVLEGMDEVNSKFERLNRLEDLGFEVCPREMIGGDRSEETINNLLEAVRENAKKSDVPIDGAVVQFDDIPYSKSLGKTGHHFKDGLAYKYEDELCETVLREVEWNTSRNGTVVPVAIFDTVEIDGCDVSRASLHNLTFIWNLQLKIGDRILVSKRNMIIPHVEANLDKNETFMELPVLCPCCGGLLTVRETKNREGKKVAVLQCGNRACKAAEIKQFVHFVDKDSMNIEGVSETTLTRFRDMGWLNDFSDLYRLAEHRDEIVEMDGFGEKSYERLVQAIETSKQVPFQRFLRAIDIPMVGRHASKIISEYFGGDISKFETAVLAEEPFDFTELKDIGRTIHQNIYEWFDEEENVLLWNKLKGIMTFEEYVPSDVMEGGRLAGQTIVVTGKVEGYTRDEMSELIIKHGGTPTDSVTKNTTLLVIGEKPGGSKLKKAEQLGTETISAEEFLARVFL